MGRCVIFFWVAFVEKKLRLLTGTCLLSNLLIEGLQHRWNDKDNIASDVIEGQWDLLRYGYYVGEVRRYPITRFVVRSLKLLFCVFFWRCGD